MPLFLGFVVVVAEMVTTAAACHEDDHGSKQASKRERINTIYIYTHIYDTSSYAQMANVDMRAKPKSNTASFKYILFGSCSSLGITSIKATYRNVPDASADNAAAPRPWAISETKNPKKILMGDAKVKGMMILPKAAHPAIAAVVGETKVLGRRENQTAKQRREEKNMHENTHTHTHTYST